MRSNSYNGVQRSSNADLVMATSNDVFQPTPESGLSDIKERILRDFDLCQIIINFSIRSLINVQDEFQGSIFLESRYDPIST